MYAQYCRLSVPVWASERQVIRAARKMLSDYGKTRACRGARHAFLREMLAEHDDARELYIRVKEGT